MTIARLTEASLVARLKHLSLRTEKAYLQHIKRFILFHNKRHPKEMGEAEIRAYLSDIIKRMLHNTVSGLVIERLLDNE